MKKLSLFGLAVLFSFGLTFGNLGDKNESNQTKSEIHCPYLLQLNGHSGHSCPYLKGEASSETGSCPFLEKNMEKESVCPYLNENKKNTSKCPFLNGNSSDSRNNQEYIKTKSS